MILRKLWMESGSPAAEAGLADGDLITKFMGDGVEIGRDVLTWFVLNDLKTNEPVTMTYSHDGTEKNGYIYADS